MRTQQHIGIFDSGVGGTSIWREIVQLLPNESTRYLADSKNAPYGDKSPQDIIKLSIKNTEELLSLGAKIIVVACNTATTNAIEHLRATYNVPFIGIEPAIKPAALASESGAIGILATRGTLSSKLFASTSGKFTEHLKVVEVVGEGLVPIIESGDLSSTTLRNLLWDYTKPMIAANIDHLVLGCSHYPYLIPILKEILPPNIKIIDSGQAVARQTKSILIKHNLIDQEASHNVRHLLYSNRDIITLKELLQDFNAPMEFNVRDF
ncbi:glutamate racemase [Dokdonia sinensis]|uniref:Glutamate racemase n=1 Tax=Dokdonia sinensis TaxID=2479847 RepID=A0A3M0FWM9_9FLAO|nr:glutamate racemase [Dokdonia sinensis]RMB57170.1 glutamate racemase [Dokdonia sinensis]